MAVTRRALLVEGNSTEERGPFTFGQGIQEQEMHDRPYGGDENGGAHFFSNGLCTLANPALPYCFKGYTEPNSHPYYSDWVLGTGVALFSTSRAITLSKMAFAVLLPLKTLNFSTSLSCFLPKPTL